MNDVRDEVRRANALAAMQRLIAEWGNVGSTREGASEMSLDDTADDIARAACEYAKALMGDVQESDGRTPAEDFDL